MHRLCKWEATKISSLERRKRAVSTFKSTSFYLNYYEITYPKIYLFLNETNYLTD